MIDESLLERVATAHGPMAIFRHDQGAVSQALRLYGEWAWNELSFIRRFAPDGATVVDVGAYVGTHAVAFSHFVGPQGRVIAFEGQPETFQVLERNVLGAALANVSVQAAVVSDRDGTMDIAAIAPAVDGSFGSASIRDQATGADRVRASCVRIDSLGLESCDLLKIDAEGVEAEVLKGARDTLARLRPVIYAECNSVEDGARTLAVLKDAGYATYLHVVDAFNPDNLSGEPNNIFGPAREAAFVAAPLEEEALVGGLTPRSCELILKIATLDDLTLGLLNKPQYPGEILAQGECAKTGGIAWLAQLHELSTEPERLRRRLEGVTAEKAELETELQSRDQFAQRVRRLQDWCKREVARAGAEVAKAKGEAYAAEREVQDIKARTAAMLEQARSAASTRRRPRGALA